MKSLPQGTRTQASVAAASGGSPLYKGAREAEVQVNR